MVIETFQELRELKKFEKGLKEAVEKEIINGPRNVIDFEVFKKEGKIKESSIFDVDNGNVEKTSMNHHDNEAFIFNFGFEND